MFLLLNNGKREQQQQQQTPEPTQFGRRRFNLTWNDNFDASWDTPSSPMRRQQQQQRRQQQQQQPKYYPENHPIHPEDERLNVKWPAKRETRPQQQQQQQQKPSKSSGVQAGVVSADSDGSFEHRFVGETGGPGSEGGAAGGVEAAYTEELETLQAENRDLCESRCRRSGWPGSWKLAMMLRQKAELQLPAGDPATQQQVDQLRDLERLQHSAIAQSANRWSPDGRELRRPSTISLLAKNPKARRKRPSRKLRRLATEAASNPVADDDDLATATNGPTIPAPTPSKKEKAPWRLLRDQVMRAKKVRGEVADDGPKPKEPLVAGMPIYPAKRISRSKSRSRQLVQQKLNEAREELKAAAEERDQARAEGETTQKLKNERRREENKRMKDELRRENDAEVDKLKQEKRRLEDKLRNIRDKMASTGQKNYKHFQGEFEELAKTLASD
uniref:Coiled-coil domain-containing protein n=1 Tax=Macrostomum lignano TaxID=282301 RepID=A0A1I8FF82_9PLAT